MRAPWDEVLAHGADAKARNAFGNTAATLAARNGHSTVESMLRKADGISLVDPVQPAWARRGFPVAGGKSTVQ
jgi:ankyrin repeat protein